MSWADNFDFGDDDDQDFANIDLSKIAKQDNTIGQSRPKFKPPSHSSSNVKPKRLTHFDLWSQRHRPKTVEDLAVHPKKVEEVKAWLLAEKRKPILVLKGPPGAGKTATISVLARKFGFSIQEWNETTQAVDYDESQRQWPPHEDTVGYESQIKRFRGFLLRANRYSVLAGLGEGNADRKVVLLDELPPFARRNGPEFRKILSDYVASTKKSPLVILISDESGQDSTKQILPEPEAFGLGVTTVTFNPATTTNLVKMLRQAALTESNSGPTSFPVPDKDTLTSIAESAKGDIRAALNSLQFACTKGKDKCGLRSSVTGKDPNASSRKRKKDGRTSVQLSSVSKEDALAKIGGRNSSLDLFHALGKVLYAKREDQTMMKGSAGRPALLFNPEEVLDSAPISNDAFICFLHQNYLNFFSQMDDIAQAMEYFDLGDNFSNEWTTSGKVCLSEYGALLAIRGIAYHNTAVAKPSVRTFQSPEWYSKFRVIRSKTEEVMSHPSMIGMSKSEALELVHPLYQKCLSLSSRSGSIHQPNGLNIDNEKDEDLDMLIEEVN